MTKRPRILVTGMTALHVGRRASYMNSPRLLVATLQALGAQVEQRPVMPGENLNDFHRVVVFLTPLADIHTTYKHGALYALYERRDDAIAGLNDWQVRRIHGTGDTVLRNGGKYLWHSTVAAGQAKRYGKMSGQLRKTIERGARMIGGRGDEWPWRVLAPLFSWGDVDAIGVRAREIVAWDPSPMLAIDRGRVGVDDPRGSRFRRWVLASLRTHDRWVKKLELRWPVERYGNNSPLSRIMRREGTAVVPSGPKIPESEVLGAYGAARGVLAAPYPHRGSGWWRARLMHAAAMGAVAYLDPSDATAQIDPSYSMPVRAIEAARADELDELAYAQARVLERRAWKRTRLLREVASIFDIPLGRPDAARISRRTSPLVIRAEPVAARSPGRRGDARRRTPGAGPRTARRR